MAAINKQARPVKRTFLVVCLLWSFVFTTGIRAGGHDVAGSQSTRAAFPISVDYERTVFEMVSAGRYDYVNPNVSDENFPLQRGKQQESIIYLFRVERVMSSEEIASTLDKEGLRPATLPELLSFGATYPNAQRAMTSWHSSRGGEITTGTTRYRVFTPITETASLVFFESI